jgi:hypothetical protein
MTIPDATSVVKRERPGIKEEIGLVPVWAYIAAVALFVLIPVCFFGFVWPYEPGPPGQFFRILIPFIPATVLAFLMLMIGYVNRDAGRRGMSRTLWTIIVIFVPNAIGFILYFLLRNPIRSQCPKCAAIVDPLANYCPHCRYSFHPTCSQCKRPVRPSDTYCANCGMQLEQT